VNCTACRKKLTLSEVPSWDLLEATEQNQRKVVMTASVLAQIQTEHLPNTSAESYSYASALSVYRSVSNVACKYYNAYQCLK
jgi:hypothetical protein